MGKFHAMRVAKFVQVHEEDWYGFDLPIENLLTCELEIIPSASNEHIYAIIFICGGRHFYKKMELADSFDKAYKIYENWLKEFNLIQDFVDPEWFGDHGFEFW